MMHVFRLLEMACEIGLENRINVRRSNRDFLLKIKSGYFEYDDLLVMAADKQQQMENAFSKPDLRDVPDREYINQITFWLRDEFYKQ